MNPPGVLLIEPYFGGSHRAFIEGLMDHVPADYVLLTQPARKWKWRMRGSAIYFASQLATSAAEVAAESGSPALADLVFCSSFLSLSDFKSIAPKPYGAIPSIAYFHENQLAYPLRAEDERDYHFGLTNITTCLAADIVCFNSHYNLDSFVDAIPAFLAKMPDFRPPALPETIRSKARVLAPPIDCSAIDRALAQAPRRDPARPPHIVWNHRWEHDKNPEDFFRALYKLSDEGVAFRLSVAGETFDDAPAVFAEARRRLERHIESFGYLPHREDYGKVLVDADIVVSTAHHEFFGMSVLEACYAGCYPVLPRRLAYVELFDDEFLYDSRRGLIERLRALLASTPPRNAARDVAERFCWSAMAPAYTRLLEEAAALRTAPS